jgi:hypothetical protein
VTRTRNLPCLALFAILLLFVSRTTLGAALAAPEAAGMRHLAGKVYVDPELAPDRAAGLLELVAAARRRVAAVYGTVQAEPNIVFCASLNCYQSFGAIGLGYTDGADLVIAPRGQRAAIIAHELAHVELSKRLGGMAKVMARIPQWFDEGQAVMVSMAEEFSEDAWKAATRDGVDAPPLATLASMADWSRVTGPYGENMQKSYGTARHEVSRWFNRSGPRGFQALLVALAANESFATAYVRAEAANAQSPVAEPDRIALNGTATPGRAPVP